MSKIPDCCQVYESFSPRNYSLSSTIIQRFTEKVRSNLETLRTALNLSNYVSGAVFLVAQLAVIAAFAFTWKRKRTDKEQGAINMSTGIVNVARTDSLCKLYEPGFGRRY